MELKLTKVKSVRKMAVLLIVPYGIETRIDLPSSA